MNSSPPVRAEQAKGEGPKGKPASQGPGFDDRRDAADGGDPIPAKLYQARMNCGGRCGAGFNVRPASGESKAVRSTHDRRSNGHRSSAESARSAAKQ